MARGAFPTRAAAIREGLLRVLGEEREAQIDAAYRRAYGAPDDDAAVVGEAGLTLEGSVANCDNVLTIPRSALAAPRGRLGQAESRALDDALRIALALDP